MLKEKIYRLWCKTEGRYHYIKKSSNLPAPTVCVTDANHEVGPISFAKEIVREELPTFFEENMYDSQGRLTSKIIWESLSKQKKITEVAMTYSSGRLLTAVTKEYNSSGALAETLTENITYVGSRVDKITRTAV